MRLPAKENIYITGATDPVHRHYHPVIGYFMNARLEGALRLMGTTRSGRLLDVGFGGGVFLPELSTRCDELFGVDIHPNIDRVRQMLAKEGVRATLCEGDVTALPFPDEHFDRVVCISVLEFVPDLGRAFSELSRVVRKEGEVIIGFPVENVITDMAFMLIGINARRAHPVNQKDIMDAAAERFRVDRLATFPMGLPLGMALFAHCRLKKR